MGNSSVELLEDEEMRPPLATQESLADMIEAAEDSEVETPDSQETTVDSVVDTVDTVDAVDTVDTVDTVDAVDAVDTVDRVDGVTDCPVSPPGRSLSSPLPGSLASPGEETASPASSSMTPAQSPSSPVAMLRNKIRHLSGSGDSRRASR